MGIYDKDPEEAFDLIKASKRLIHNRDLFTKEQDTFFAQVMFALNERLSRMFFLDGPGGTGKTFVLNTIIDAVKTGNKM
ncbi:hypothetical protein PGT21_034426 [Puccinia graminis f. sp. tritici]|uniref:ATP-dependent DNA helicase n=1 Tax=Puccinia graminis f. sp. tritici TaxID=56615 RepID=A0A5B0QCE2_PUCGR|nr:hypothetical protein PGT21_034426 [Puccinia graminis f. sp. tritici]